LLQRTPISIKSKKSRFGNRNCRGKTKMHFLMTNDVESFSIPLNRYDVETAKEAYEVGLPRLLDLYARHDLKCTFYFTGTFAEQSPESVELVKEHGHEIGCHGYDHSPQRAFDYLRMSSGIS
jgi:peptidoglycan/xylan/chitin deacetylase (PgdA/CDA1 family)